MYLQPSLKERKSTKPSILIYQCENQQVFNPIEVSNMLH